MDYSERIKEMGLAVIKWLCIPALAFTTACDSSLIREAKKAENDERVISNELMSEIYPKSFEPGSPKYLERDFEAGADFICDEIKIKYLYDICAEPQINWRR